MGEDRNWMYSDWDKKGNYIDEWMNKITTVFGPCFLIVKDSVVPM
jgi:hypothetical protein